jgi:poly(3-hydroxybutyrate) depolymerase
MSVDKCHSHTIGHWWQSKKERAILKTAIVAVRHSWDRFNTMWYFIEWHEGNGIQ